MCGIVGFVNKDGSEANREILERMNRAIVHRGPDDDGFYIKENVGMAMRRLSIIDLAGGKQPIRNANGTKWIVYNGEIYNYKELREGLEQRGHRFYTNSDTEAIVLLYDEYGEDCLRHLRGMFAFAIWDEDEKSLFIARDRVGKKPLLYSHRPNGSLVFGSEFSAVLQHPDISRAVDAGAIDNYLSYLCIPAPMTAYKEIRKLEPGHWLRWKAGAIETKRYWRKMKRTSEERSTTKASAKILSGKSTSKKIPKAMKAQMPIRNLPMYHFMRTKCSSQMFRSSSRKIPDI